MNVSRYLNCGENISWITGSKRSHYHQNLSTGMTRNVPATIMKEISECSQKAEGKRHRKERGRRLHVERKRRDKREEGRAERES